MTSPTIVATLICVTKVKVGQFRDRASELIRRAASGETVLILNRNRPVAKLVPVAHRTAPAAGLLGSLAGTATVVGDIEAPIAGPDRWFRALR